MMRFALRVITRYGDGDNGIPIPESSHLLDILFNFEREELLDSEDEYEYNLIEYDDCRTDAQRGALEMVTLADVEPLALDADGISHAASDDDDELEFLDEVVSD
ncbi:hypothetical protein Droror1_Dr00001086 [Drosera rotundifolia]